MQCCSGAKDIVFQLLFGVMLIYYVGKKKRKSSSCYTVFKFATLIYCRNLVDDFTALLSSIPCPGQDFKTGGGHCAGDQGSSGQETSVSCAMCLRDSFLCCHYPNTSP